VALPFTLKKYLKAKRSIMKTQMFYHAKNLIFKTSSKTKSKSLKNIITL
jgi:hypothetical protein